MLGSTALTMAANAAPASAAPPCLKVDKPVSRSDLKRGAPFPDQIQTTCAEESCPVAALTDPLPPDLTGYPITGVSVSPGTIAPELSWTESGVLIERPGAVGQAT